MGYHENYHHQDPAAVDFRSFYPYTPNEVKHRKRTTSFQLKTLEGIFKTDTKPNAALRQELALRLEMTPRGVQVWFQNRRAKEKTKALKQRGAAASRSGSLDEGNLDDDVLEGPEGDGGDGDEAPNQPGGSREADASQSPARSRSPSNMIPSPPQLHLITDATKFPCPWQTPPVEHTSDNATVSIRPPTNTFLSSSTPSNDLYVQRRGSLPAPAVQPPTTSSENPLADPFDPLLRRGSVDASLAKLANNPYANLARAKNTALYGPDFQFVGAGSAPRSRLPTQLPYGCPQPRPRYSLASGAIPVPRYGDRRLSMDSRPSRSSQLGRVHPRMSPAPPTPYNAVIRASLPEHQLYTLSPRTVPSPIPGPLPSPGYSFGAASTPSLASPSSGESERNSPDSSRSFFREEEPEDELPSPTYAGGYSRFGSIASVATSESSMNSSYYAELGGHVSERVLVNDRRDSCASGFLGMLSELDVNGQSEQTHHNGGMTNCTPHEDYTFGTAEHAEPHGGGEYHYQYGQVQHQQEHFQHTESSYSPASTVSPGKISSPNPQEHPVITLPTVSLNTSGELAFALDSKSQQEIAHQEQYLSYHVVDHSNGTEPQQDSSYYASQHPHPHSQPQSQDPSFTSSHYGPPGNVYTADSQHHQQLDYYNPDVAYGDHLAGPGNVLDNGMQSTDAFVAYT